MRFNPILIAALAAALPGFVMAAQDVDSKQIDKRQKTQQERIDKGVQSGTVTKKEAARLEKGQSRVDAAEKKAAADGKVTAKERAHIDKMQNNQSQDIHKQRADKQRSPSAQASAGASKPVTATSPLADRQTAYAAEESKAMTDGVISPIERVRLNNMRRELNMPDLPEKPARD